jgi:NAD(P)-dependent dehydrogenase (short-subunit alcohol dehydrogenase family)
MDIAGTTALVTGVSSGLGAATAERLLARGAHVLGLDLAAPDAAPDGMRFEPADVASAGAVEAALATLTDGDPPLRIVVNCAGIAPAQRLLSSKGVHDLDVFRRTIEVNLVGTFNVLRLAAARMAAQDADAEGNRGVVVNTASIAAFEGQIGQVAYAASKAGVAGMTLPAARDLARSGIRVVTIAPGIVDTPMLAGLGDEVRDSLAAVVPFPHRLARPEEFARLVETVIGHDYLNGETIRLDGALRMQP